MLINSLKLVELIKCQSCRNIETNQLIFSANQLTCFYMMATLAFNELILELKQIRKYVNSPKHIHK